MMRKVKEGERGGEAEACVRMPGVGGGPSRARAREGEVAGGM